MNQTLSVRIIVTAILACGFPTAVRADLSENTILQTGSALNLDTGAVARSGGDILWNGTTIARQGSATLRNNGVIGSTNFNGLPESYWGTDAGGASGTSIAANLLVTGDVFVAITNSGKITKVMVIANSGGAITLQFTTFEVSAAPGVPVIAQILNNSSLTPVGMPNYGIAPSSILVVQGSDLADAGNLVLQDSSAGLPLTLNGASITVVVGGVTTHPALYYTSPAQLAAVLPAATPVGTGTLIVNYRGANSAPAPIQVVASAIGINEYNQIPIPLGVLNTNVDLGVATDAVSGALFSFTNSATPGQIIVLWATGLGADPADSDTTYTSTPHSVNTPLQIYVGGVLANILYQGSAGYPGVNQINLTIPASVTADCQVPLVAVTGRIISNVVVLPIHQGGGTCVKQGTAGVTISGDQILKDTQDTLKAGSLTVLQTSSTDAKGVRTVSSSAGASFFKSTGLLAGATGRGDNLSPGSCAVYPIITGGAITVVGLDAGLVTLTPPTGPAIPLPPALGFKGNDGAPLTSNVIPAGGVFTFNGTGGADVGPFSATLTVAYPNFNWTNPSVAAIIDRTQGLLYTWAGGLPGTFVLLGGTSTGSGVTAGYSCKVPVEAGQFTVPSYILLGMPAGSGGASIQQHDTDSSFSATGLDETGVTAVIEFSVTANIK
ncbi:MAG TPA: hypothetical protein VK752_12740 [Bryobacteraceae bacterium]|nr:hypothetical protein [Bryobacteraceae bacterium]